ncbi:hypothetical protein [Gordonia sp. SND2]|uniref:hypothetical protein n=1 Tax=Gordonia sp. SND2 TaxID=3388659 RepID=UPI00398B62FE
MAAPKVTVLDGIPVGRRAVLRIDGELWLAFPLSKTARLHTYAARLFGITGTARRQLTDLVAERPDLYPLLKPALTTLSRAENIPAWCHDRPDQKRPKPMNWRKTIRDWARDLGATHATIHSCGPEKQLTITSITTRIRSVHGALASLDVHIDDTTATVTYPGGRIAAVIDTPMRATGTSQLDQKLEPIR